MNKINKVVNNATFAFKKAKMRFNNLFTTFSLSQTFNFTLTNSLMNNIIRHVADIGKEDCALTTFPIEIIKHIAAKSHQFFLSHFSLNSIASNGMPKTTTHTYIQYVSLLVMTIILPIKRLIKKGDTMETKRDFVRRYIIAGYTEKRNAAIVICANKNNFHGSVKLKSLLIIDI